MTPEQIDTLLITLGMQRGAPPMNPGQFQRRTLAYKENIWPTALRELHSDAFVQWVAIMTPAIAQAELNYAFNHKLAAYRAAVARLEKYRLAEGRPEVTQEVETDKINEDGTPYVETVVAQAAIEPLPATVESVNADGQTVVSPNPLIVADDAERDAAQDVIDATTQEVKDFTG